MQRTILSAANGITHGIGAVTLGSLIDSLFPYSEDEAILPCLMKLCAQNLMGGLAFGAINELLYKEGADSDPTGGAYISVPYFLSQPAYQLRVKRLSRELTETVKGLVSGGIETIRKDVPVAKTPKTMESK